MKKSAPAAAPAETKLSVYEVITNLVIEQLEKGVVLWQKPWAAGGQSIWPSNYATKRCYNGFNAFFLNFAAAEQAPYFLTFAQARHLGGYVRAGEKGYPIIFVQQAQEGKPGREGDSQKQEGKSGFLRKFTVFHYSQIDGIDFVLPPPPPAPEPLAILAQAEALVAAYAGHGPQVVSRQQRAYYSPRLDYVNMPARDSFTSAEAYYQVLFHELTHSTGHATRLSREGITALDAFGSPRYAREELIAEMGASFLCGFAGISPQTVEQSAGYIKNWLTALRHDSKLVITAAAQAEKAIRFMLGDQHPQALAGESAESGEEAAEGAAPA